MGLKDIESDYSYTNKGLQERAEEYKGLNSASNTYISGIDPYASRLNTRPDPVDKIKAVEVVIKALGTMVIVQDIQSDPVNIGQVINKGAIQKPILLGQNRTIAENKLIDLIKSI